MPQITHRVKDGRLVQIVSPQRLREVLDEEGSDYERPKDFGPNDEWCVEDLHPQQDRKTGA